MLIWEIKTYNCFAPSFSCFLPIVTDDQNDHKSHLWQGNGNIAKQRTEKQNRNAIAMP